jgi:hypothetical protein
MKNHILFYCSGKAGIVYMKIPGSFPGREKKDLKETGKTETGRRSLQKGLRPAGLH